MDSGTAIANARFAFSNGRAQEGLAILKTRLHGHRDELDVRQELAEAYRKLGHPDQAGRWGLLVPGWSSDEERDAFIRAFITPGIAERRVEQLVAMPRDAALPGGFEALVKPTGRFYRLFRPFGEDMEATARVMGVGVVIVAAVTMAITTTVAFIGGEDARFIARAGTTVTAIPVIGWSITWATANAIQHCPRSSRARATRLHLARTLSRSVLPVGSRRVSSRMRDAQFLVG
jgi:hypothetical protein